MAVDGPGKGQVRSSIFGQSQAPPTLGGPVFPRALEGNIGRISERLLGGIEDGFRPTRLVPGLDGYQYKSFHDRLPSRAFAQKGVGCGAKSISALVGSDCRLLHKVVSQHLRVRER